MTFDINRSYTLAYPYEDLQQYYKLDPEGISEEARSLIE